MTNFRTAMIAVAVVAAMTGSQALAGEGALAPGKPAGVYAAQRSPNLLLMAGVVTVVVIGVVVATQSSDDAVCGAACVAPATTTTS